MLPQCKKKTMSNEKARIAFSDTLHDMYTFIYLFTTEKRKIVFLLVFFFVEL